MSGRITLDAKWYIGQELVGYGRKPADYDHPAFQGIHARYVLVIIDEAGGVPKSIFDAVDALATNIDARVVAVGNPDDPASAQGFVTLRSEDRDSTCRPPTVWDALFGCVRAARVRVEAAYRRLVTRERMAVLCRGSND
jgi:hypothetical protein